jgi:hypothetical protein
MRGGDAAARRCSIIDGESPVVLIGCGGFLKQVEVTGEVRRTVNRVHGAWGGGSPRKVSTVAFPHNSGEVGGSPAPAMDEMQRGRDTESVVRLLGGGERWEGIKYWARRWQCEQCVCGGVQYGVRHAAGGKGGPAPETRVVPAPGRQRLGRGGRTQRVGGAVQRETGD